MFRIWILCTAIPLVLPLAVLSQDKKPNIVVIMTDDQGYGELSCYGAKDLQTPNLDRFVSQGMRFDFFRANSTVCSPTRASFLTGRFPDRAGVPGVIRTHQNNSWGWLAKDIATLPEALRPAGYESALIGKWHLGLNPPHTPNDRGFDLFKGFLGDMMDDYWTHLRHENNYMRENAKAIRPDGHATDLFTQWACDYLKNPERRQKPFFLFLAYNAPHDPVQPPDEWLQKVKTRHPETPEKRSKLIAFVEHLDHAIGKVLLALKQNDLEENTIVVFTSDNGGALQFGANNGATRDGKGSMYEGGLRVPFAVRWPNKIQEGSRSSVPAVTMDLFPSFLEAAKAPAVHSIDGVSLLGIWLGEKTELPSRELYFVRREGGNLYGGKTIEALIQGDWKLLQNSPYAPMELYHLSRDPLETTNLAGREPVFHSLAAALRRHIQRGGSVPWQPEEEDHRAP